MLRLVHEEPVAAQTQVGTAPGSSPLETGAPGAAAAPPAEQLVADPPSSPVVAQNYDIDSAASTTVIVNKARPLDGGAAYAPADLVEAGDGEVLRADAAAALTTLYEAADAAGHGLRNVSGYRSFATQESTYGGYVASLGQEGADLTSARPGHSEHQTGLVMDIVDADGVCGIEDACMSQIPAGQWLAANSWQYGFVLRYPAGMTHVTGFEFEPWHYRYIGVEAATAYHSSGALTLEEFFGLDAAPEYL